MRKLFLKPFAWPYRLLMTTRNCLFDLKILRSYKSKLPIICVGNLAVGGSGKSPFAQYLALELSKKKRVALLSRGYRGKVKGPHRVTAQNTAAEVGDEAVMHCRALGEKNVPIIIACSRVLGVKYIEEHDLADLVILDDGFQHRWLDRDLDLLLFDISSKKTLADLKADLLLPAGCLRESRAQAFRRADAIVLINRNGTTVSNDSFQLFAVNNLPVFEISLVSINFYKASKKEQVSLEYFKGVQGSAITAIAKPEAFFASLDNLGIELSVKKSFRDHHYFSERDFLELTEPIFTTAKDCVKLDRLIDKGKDVYVLEQAVALQDSTAFLNFLHRSFNP